jgi:hypothetical protein
MILPLPKGELMAHDYWFGVKFEFVCPSCCITSIEKDAINSPTEDFFKLKATIDGLPRRCQHCKTPLAEGTDFDVQIVPDTRESLFRLGFAVPELPGDR